MKSPLLILFLCAAVPLHAQELPMPDPSGNGLDFEPQILLIEPELTESGTRIATITAAELDAARTKFQRARSKSERWARLAKQGILSKMEAEQAEVQAVEAEAAYQEKLLLLTQQEVVTSGSTSESAANLERAQGESLAARRKRYNTKVAFARKMVERLRALRSANLGSASQLKRAEAALQRLEQEKP